MRFHPTLAVLAALALTTACADSPTDPALVDAHAAFGHNAVRDAEFGTTGGWADGKTVEFFYRKDFFCRGDVPGESGCGLNVEPTVFPRGGRIPVVYVMTPLGFRPDDATLHCPEVGECINHPNTLNVSAVFGPGNDDFPLPAHSHIVEGPGDLKAGQAGWWEIEVVGVSDPAVWDAVVEGKSLRRVRELQAAGIGITPDLPTNLFLFFGVRPAK